MPEISEANATGPVTWVFTDDELQWLLEAVLGASECIVDLETTGLDEWAVEGGKHNGGVGARISLASFTLPQAVTDAFGQRVWNGETPVTWVLPLSHPDSPFRGRWQRALRTVFLPAIAAKIPMVNQNIKFDARWLNATCGIDISDLIVWDTKDAQHLLDETRSTKLKEAVPRIFGIPAWNDFDLSTPGASERVPLLDLGAYAARDTWWTWRWMKWQREQMFLEGDETPFDGDDIERANLGKLAVWSSMPTVASLTKVEQRRIRIDVEWVTKKLEEDELTSKISLDEMADRYGMSRENATTAPTSHWWKAFTEEAVRRDELRVLAITKNGIPSWGKGVLAKNARMGSELAKLVVTQKQASKRAEFLRSWLSLEHEGYIAASYNSGSVATGRLSSSNPNMQQVTKKLRPAFIPSDGYYMADFDYSQIELRVAAYISRSMPMIEAFREGADLHRRFAGVINNVPELDVTPDQRQGAKAGNFGLLYDMGAYGFRAYAEEVYGVMLSMEEAVRIHTAFGTMWAGIREWHESIKTTLWKTGQVSSPLGRVRRLPKIFDGNDKVANSAERQGINSPVQSMASDLLQMAMASVQGLLTVADLPAIDGIFPVGTVHDSMVAELEQSNWKAIAEETAHRMATLDTVLTKFGIDFDVPLVADYTVGTRWSLSDISDPEDPEKQLANDVDAAFDEIDMAEL